MVVYKGILMQSDRDYVDVARELDDAFADILEDYLYDTSLLLYELEDCEKTIYDLSHSDEQEKIKSLQATISEKDAIINRLSSTIDDLNIQLSKERKERKRSSENNVEFELPFN